jgi:hypothetical protein
MKMRVERPKNELQNDTNNLKEISPQIEDMKTKIKVLEGKIMEEDGARSITRRRSWRRFWQGGQ